METALHSWSFREYFANDKSFTVFKALDRTAAMGFHAIEIMAGKANMPPGDFARDDLPYLKSVLDHAGRLGIRVTCLSTYNDFAYVKDEAWRLANIAYIKKWLQIAADLGVVNIRMLTGYYGEGEDRARLEKLTLDGIRECVPVAEACGVNMALENHNSIFFTAEEILKLIREMGSRRLTTCPDPSNWCRTFFAGDCPAAERENVLASAAKLAPLATQSHLKIKGIAPDGKLAGWGDDLVRLLRLYRDAGYAGVVAFESIVDGDKLAPLAQARQIVEAAIRQVQAEKQ